MKRIIVVPVAFLASVSAIAARTSRTELNKTIVTAGAQLGDNGTNHAYMILNPPPSAFCPFGVVYIENGVKM